MSQITRPYSGAMPPPAGFIATETGNTGGAVGPDGAMNLNVVGDGNFITVTGTPGTNTLTISPVNITYITAQTLDAVPLTVYTLGITVNEALRLRVSSIAAYSTFADALSEEAEVLAVRGAGAAVISDTVGERLRTINVTDGAGVNFALSGNSIIIQLTGVAATTINWKLYVDYITYP